MTGADWAATAIIALLALVGARQGLLAGALSLAGLVGGAILGAHIAPQLLARGSSSPWTPLLALAGAVAFAAVFQAVGLSLGLLLGNRVLRLRPLRVVDALGGLAVGALSGVVVVWVLGAVALQLPGQTQLRRAAQRSLLLRKLNSIVPPRDALSALGRIDPLLPVTVPLAPVPPPNPAVLRLPGVRGAAPSVVKIVGTACGLGIEGSGWVEAPGLVVTAAHVLAGVRDASVEAPGSAAALSGKPVVFDPRNDVAVLRVPGLRARPLPLVDPVPGRAVAILGYPEDGSFAAAPGRIGRTGVVLTVDAYGHGPFPRLITTIRGRIRHGDSGGPVVDAAGAVEATVFAARTDAPAGLGVPSAIVRTDVSRAKASVSTGSCVG
ncbi:MAG: MarP family serine protease [Gaiellaceae bacterium]